MEFRDRDAIRAKCRRSESERSKSASAICIVRQRKHLVNATTMYFAPTAREISAVTASEMLAVCYKLSNLPSYLTYTWQRNQARDKWVYYCSLQNKMLCIKKWITNNILDRTRKRTRGGRDLSETSLDWCWSETWGKECVFREPPTAGRKYHTCVGRVSRDFWRTMPVKWAIGEHCFLGERSKKKWINK